MPPGAKRVVRRVARSAGRATSSARMLPDFLIVGGQRCGTTSLYRTLIGHPSVLPAVLAKGVHYFDTGFDHGWSWYRSHFPLAGTARLVQLRTGTRPVTGEGSPYYMFHPLAPARIAAALPSVKVVLLLRDPVERAHSHHVHEVVRGFEPERDFERALDLEPGRLAGEVDRIRREPAYNSYAHQFHSYAARGRYAEQLTELRAHLPAEQIHVMDAQDYFSRPAPAFAELLDFLRLPQWSPPEFGRHNAHAKSGLPAHLRRRLEREFEPHDRALVELLGWTPSWLR